MAVPKRKTSKSRRNKRRSHHRVPTVNILEDKKAQEKVIKINNGRATVPTIIIKNSKDEIVLSEPTDSELAKAISKLSLK